jgi:hypothetical protein
MRRRPWGIPPCPPQEKRSRREKEGRRGAPTRGVATGASRGFQSRTPQGHPSLRPCPSVWCPIGDFFLLLPQARGGRGHAHDDTVREPRTAAQELQSGATSASPSGSRCRPLCLEPVRQIAASTLSTPRLQSAAMLHWRRPRHQPHGGRRLLR